MLVLQTISYEAQGIPKGCRKPRTQRYTTDIAVEVPDVAIANAPLVLEVPRTNRRWDAERSEDVLTEFLQPYRVHAGQLWVPTGISAAEAGAVIAQHAGNEHRSWRDAQAIAEASVHRLAQDWASRHVVIEQTMWTPADEPCIVIEDRSYRCPFNIGFHSDVSDLRDVSDGLVFRLDEVDLAQAELDRLLAEHARDNATTTEHSDRFDLSAHVLLHRGDLLTRPPFRMFQAQVRFHAALNKLHRAHEPVNQLLRSLSDLRGSFCLAPIPEGCNAAAMCRLDGLLTEVVALMDERRLASAIEQAA